MTQNRNGNQHPMDYVLPDEEKRVKLGIIKLAMTDVMSLIEDPDRHMSHQPFVTIGRITKAAYDSVVEHCPPSADRSAALRNIRLLRNCLNQVGLIYSGHPPVVERELALSEAKSQWVQAVFNANASIAMDGAF